MSIYRIVLYHRKNIEFFDILFEYRVIFDNIAISTDSSLNCMTGKENYK